MRPADTELLEGIGLGLYERNALMALMLCGVADAATLCREGDVPSSKIYRAMEKLAGLGLVQIQPTSLIVAAVCSGDSDGIGMAGKSTATPPSMRAPK